MKRTYKCAMIGDSITVQDHVDPLDEPLGHDEKAHVFVTVDTHEGVSVAMLTPAKARRVADAIRDAARSAGRFNAKPKHKRGKR